MSSGGRVIGFVKLLGVLLGMDKWNVFKVVCDGKDVLYVGIGDWKYDYVFLVYCMVRVFVIDINVMEFVCI